MHLYVIGVFRAERTRSRNRVAKQQTTRIDRNEQPLVRIERNRIGAFEPREQIGLALVQYSGRAVRAVNVKPQIKLPRDLGYLIQRINRSRIRRPRTRHVTKLPKSVALIRVYPCA